MVILILWLCRPIEVALQEDAPGLLEVSSFCFLVSQDFVARLGGRIQASGIFELSALIL